MYSYFYKISGSAVEGVGNINYLGNNQLQTAKQLNTDRNITQDCRNQNWHANMKKSKSTEIGMN